MPRKCTTRNGSLTINVRTLCKSLTKMNVSKDAMFELKNYIEDCLVPKIITASERYAKLEKKNTIQERDYIRARDYINVALRDI